MARVVWVIGNWKQNHLREAARACAQGVAEGLAEALAPAGSSRDVRVGIAPPYLSLDAARPFTRPHRPVWLFAQDVSAQDSGAYTGEVGPAMLAEAGVEGSIIGHSERRALYAEDDTTVARKLEALLRAGMTAIVCVGERLEERTAGHHETTVISQLSGAFSRVKPEDVDDRVIIAYEPVWAIGTGHTATPEQASQMHRTIRAWLGDRFGARGTDRSILYGGSVKPDNAAALCAAGDIDGFLVGGASLDPSSFLAIVRAAASTAPPSP